VRLRSYYLNPLALCVCLGLVLAGVYVDFQDRQAHQLPMLFGVSALVAILAWAFNYKRLLAISEVPISTIASAAQGYVELFGKSRQRFPMRSPIQGVACVWFRLWVYARDSNYMWRLQDYQVSEQVFELHDDSGVCLVDPKGADVYAAKRHVITQNGHRYIEDVLFADKSIYVLGDLDAGTQAHTEAEINREVGKLLTQWKQSKARLLQRFDLNRDGEIDMLEWEHARELAYSDIKRQQSQLLKSEQHLIAKPQNKRLFVISGITPEALRQRYRYWAIVHFSIFFIAVLFSFVASYLAI
jgi:hypothetical protein